jgi:Na+-transporting NADH:ubiquinone oxidoreductase subunit C
MKLFKSTRPNMKSFANLQAGFFELPNDNIVKTIGVATLLCLVCSIVVSGAATLLKPTQVANALLDKKDNILVVAGIERTGKTVDELFTQIETRVVDMATGDFTDAVDAASFDQRKASKDPAYRVKLSKQQDKAQIGGRSKYANVYLVRDGDDISKIILPIKGYGLWSTLYGFIALEGDAQTVSGITFYEHKETPGLGGEIENKKWQASWKGKKIIDATGQPAIRLIKGTVSADTTDAEYKIDGLAGATLTSTGVSNLVQFWMGDDGFGPYLKRARGIKSQAAHIKSVILPVESSLEQG